jgi:hypothetical protein
MIDQFFVPIHLGVKSWWQFPFHILKVEKPIPELGCKLRPMIKNDIFRKTMLSKNIIKE